jgi:hypothetical protein
MSESSPGKQFVALALALLAAVSMWYYVQRIVVPHQEKEAVDRDRPRGNLSDLYPRWLGARELLLRGRDPYSREVTLEIQEGYWGRRLDPSRPNDPKDQQGFAYPVYVAFLLAPTVRMDFAVVHTLYFWWSTGFAVLSVFVWKRALGARLLPWETLTAVILVLASYPFAEAFSVQQPLLFDALVLGGSFLARRHGWLFLSGVLLAVATFKPQVAFLPVILMLLWVSGEWRQRQRWLWGFASTMVLLVGASEYMLRGWLFRFYDAVRAYSDYTSGTAFLDWFVSPRWSGVVRLLLILPVLWICWKSRYAESDSVASGRGLSLVLVATVCIAPNLATYNQVLLIPALFLLWDQRLVLHQGGIVSRNLTRIIAVLLVWPWVACGTLIAARIGFHAEEFVMRAWQLPLYTTLSLPAAILLLLFLWPARRDDAKHTFAAAQMLS